MKKTIENLYPLVDAPGQAPRMHFTEYASKLASMIENAGQSPMTVGITDIEGFAYVLSLGPRTVGVYVRRKYRKLFVGPEEYVQKMFQVPFYLPHPEPRHIEEETKRLLKNVQKPLPEEPWARQLVGVLEGKWQYLPPNTRQVKRILNMHQLIAAAHTSRLKEIPRELLLGLILVQVCWPRAYWAVYNFRESFPADIYEFRAGSFEADPPDAKRHLAAADQLKRPEFHDVCFNLLFPDKTTSTDLIRSRLDLMRPPVEEYQAN